MKEKQKDIWFAFGQANENLTVFTTGNHITLSVFSHSRFHLRSNFRWLFIVGAKAMGRHMFPYSGCMCCTRDYVPGGYFGSLSCVRCKVVCNFFLSYIFMSQFSARYLMLRVVGGLLTRFLCFAAIPRSDSEDAGLGAHTHSIELACRCIFGSFDRFVLRLAFRIVYIVFFLS